MVTRGARRGDVVIADLSAAEGREMMKSRPVLVVSPDVINESSGTYLIAPMTSGRHPYHFRVPCRFRGKSGHVVLDQVRVIDAGLVSPPIGTLAPATVRNALNALREMFEE